MVVKPETLIKKIIEDEKKAIVQLEAKIDDELTKNYKGYGIVELNVTELFSKLRPTAQEELVKTYKLAGWTVDYSNDRSNQKLLRFKYSD